ncbi:hypothetical protein [Streptomyces sp. NPDC101234]|uniref:hypothetical protein n=1 Tax=Streptomyces sp. NPDC101234 TaxID=3366138 RepID=UPI0037F8A764
MSTPALQAMAGFVGDVLVEAADHVMEPDDVAGAVGVGAGLQACRRTSLAVTAPQDLCQNPILVNIRSTQDRLLLSKPLLKRCYFT